MFFCWKSRTFVQNSSKEIEEEPTTGSELLRFARKAWLFYGFWWEHARLGVWCEHWAGQSIVTSHDLGPQEVAEVSGNPRLIWADWGCITPTSTGNGQKYWKRYLKQNKSRCVLLFTYMFSWRISLDGALCRALFLSKIVSIEKQRVVFSRMAP